MKRPRTILRGVVVGAIVLSLPACDAQKSSPIEPGQPALGKAPFESTLPPLPAFCAANTYQRTPEQVLEDHRAAVIAGNLNAVYCNYAVDAVVISDAGVDQGQDAIHTSLEGFSRLFGGSVPQVVQQITVRVPDNRKPFPPAKVLDQSAPTDMVRLLFTFASPCVTIADGVDTYIIRSGQIHAQTSHATPVFTCAP